ncbi:Transcriptional regulator OS=Streptomyces antimycoticus OX=68175 GN=SSPO_036000 PE=4 SV=1 [Streptomyces antimycoticus]
MAAAQGRAADAITASTGKVAKMESGWVPMREPDIRALCALYGASDVTDRGPAIGVGAH